MPQNVLRVAVPIVSVQRTPRCFTYSLVILRREADYIESQEVQLRAAFCEDGHGNPVDMQQQFRVIEQVVQRLTS